MDKIIPINKGEVSDMQGGNIGFIFLESFFTPLIMFIANFIVLPFAIHVTSYYEKNELKSQAQRVNMRKMYGFMLLTTIVLPIAEFSSIMASIYFFVKPDRYQQMKKYSVDIALKIFTSMEYYLRFLCQIVLMSVLIHIGTLIVVSLPFLTVISEEMTTFKMGFPLQEIEDPLSDSRTGTSESIT